MSAPPDPAPAPHQLPLSGGDLLLILIFGLGAVRVLGAVVVVGMGLTNPDKDTAHSSVLMATVLLLVAQTLAILLAIRALAIRKHGLSWADLGFRPAARQWYGRAAAIAIFLVPAVALVNFTIGQIEGKPFENPQIYAIAPAGFNWTGLIVMTVVAGAVAPFAEEIAFRGLFFAWLRERIGLLAAVAISAVAFGSLHGVIQLIPSLTVIGAVLAVLYHRCGSLYPVMLTHGLFNAIMVVTLYSALAGATTGP